MSYLAFPVAINGKITTPEGRPFHLTVKYFGKETFISTDQIRERLAGLDVSPPGARDQPNWKPETFSDLFYVLELTNPPKRLLEARIRLGDLCRDDFPGYRPHITMPKFWWDFIKVQPGNTSLEFGPMMLMGVPL